MTWCFKMMYCESNLFLGRHLPGRNSACSPSVPRGPPCPSSPGDSHQAHGGDIERLHTWHLFDDCGTGMNAVLRYIYIYIQVYVYIYRFGYIERERHICVCVNEYISSAWFVCLIWDLLLIYPRLLMVYDVSYKYVRQSFLLLLLVRAHLPVMILAHFWCFVTTC